MQSSKFLELAEKIKKRDKEVFDTLMEFEKTKQMRTKARLNFTIDKVLADKFRKFCRSNRYNMSAKIEQAIEKMISEAG